ncbi:MAG: DUF2497 domain-containing protein [Rickettsiales bacterium]|nr:DUF2497 domain-containing protein [Rickettsiales bacterium]
MSDTEAAEATEGEDQSMEEILQSIRRIITEDEQEVDTSEEVVAEEPEPKENEVVEEPVEEMPEPELEPEIEPEIAADADSDEIEMILAEEEAPVPEPEPVVEPEIEEEEDDDSDILELTEILEDEPEMDNTLAVEEDTAEEDDIFGDLDAMLEDSTDLPEEAPAVETFEPMEDDGTLISEGPAAATAAIFDEVKQQAAAASEHSDGLAMRSGTSVEDLMIEAMRPMLKAWLDENLPAVVERVVQKEVKKLAE